MSNYIPNLESLIDFSFIGQSPNSVKKPVEPQAPSFQNSSSSHLNADWQNSTISPNVLPFSVSPGLNSEIPTNEIGFFRLFISEGIVLYMAEEMNNYAKVVLSEAEFNKFPLITTEELNDFLSLIIYMGVSKLPTYRLYWQKFDNPYFQEFPGTLMVYKRFALIKRFFKVFDYETSEEFKGFENRKSKLNELFEHFNNIFSSIYTPERELVLEENLCALSETGGGLELTSPVKPVKYDVELYALCEAETGYVCSFLHHQGNKAEKNSDIVLRLTKNYQNRNHHLYMDNFYTSVPLFNQLKSVGIYCCGSQRENGCGPKSFKAGPRKMDEGDSVLKQTDAISCLELNDNVGSVILTNIHSGNQMPYDPVDMTQHPMIISETAKSAIVQAYNTHIKGAGLMIQTIRDYEIEKKAKKWSTKLGIHALEMAFFNSYCMYKRFSHHSPPSSYLDYLIAIILTLQAESREKKEQTMGALGKNTADVLESNKVQKIIRASVQENEVYGKISHYPVALEKKKRCNYCARKKLRKEVYSACSKCKVPLCHIGCFENYHNE